MHLLLFIFIIDDCFEHWKYQTQYQFHLCIHIHYGTKAATRERHTYTHRLIERQNKETKREQSWKRQTGTATNKTAKYQSKAEEEQITTDRDS